MNFGKTLAAFAAAGSLVFGVVACGGEPEPDPWANAANYQRPETFGNAERKLCYYWEDRAEVDSLKESGLCEQDWNAYQLSEDNEADVDFMFMYLPYFMSREYTGYHVPAHKRTSHDAKMKNFSVKYAPQIKAAAPRATYVDNFGKKTTGDRVNPANFGGGVRSKGGSGIRNCALGTAPTDTVVYAAGVTVYAKGGGGSSGGGGRSSGGGGSVRSGSGSSGSKGGFSGGNGSVSRPGPGSSGAKVTRGGC